MTLEIVVVEIPVTHFDFEIKAFEIAPVEK